MIFGRPMAPDPQHPPDSDAIVLRFVTQVRPQRPRIFIPKQSQLVPLRPGFVPDSSRIRPGFVPDSSQIRPGFVPDSSRSRLPYIYVGSARWHETKLDGTIINYPPAPLHGQGLMRVGAEPRSAGQGGSASSSSTSSSTSSSNMPNGVSPGVFAISNHASMPQIVA